MTMPHLGRSGPRSHGQRVAHPNHPDAAARGLQPDAPAREAAPRAAASAWWAPPERKTLQVKEVGDFSPEKGYTHPSPPKTERDLPAHRVRASQNIVEGMPRIR